METESKNPELKWERRLQEVASSFRYPATPDIQAKVRMRLRADSVRRAPVGSAVGPWGWRRLAVPALVAFLALATLLAVPSVRAAVARFLGVGAITILVSDTEEALGLPPEPTGGSTVTRAPVLEGRVTLAEAEEAAGFSILLPGSSAGIGLPDEVYLQQPDSMASQAVVILVWREPEGLETPTMSLYQIGIPGYGLKEASLDSITATEVKGEPAFWVEGEHVLQVWPLLDDDGDVEERLAGNVLVWTDGELTFRLEGAPSLAEAVRIAESLVAAGEN